MIAELIEHYRVRIFTAVFKTANGRSARLLERLGFVVAPAALCAQHEVEPDETMMHRAAKVA
jgi:hypothetical protein